MYEISHKVDQLGVQDYRTPRSYHKVDKLS